MNFDTSTTWSSFTVGVRLPQGFSVSAARMTTPDGPDTPLTQTTVVDRVNVTVPALDTASLLIIEGAWGNLIFADGFEIGDTSAWSP